MNGIIKECRELGIDSVDLWPSKGKVPFYEKLGFYALPSEQPHMNNWGQMKNPIPHFWSLDARLQGAIHILFLRVAQLTTHAVARETWGYR